MDYKDYYKILGVSKSATDKEIKSAFRKLAQKYHPDKNPGNQQAEEKFKELNEANEVLGDPQKRARYDQLGASYTRWERAGRPGGGFDWGQWAGGSGRTRVNYDDLNDLFGSGGFSDFFTTVFGAGRGPGEAGSPYRTTRTAARQRGEDQEQPIQVTLEEAYHGDERALQKGGQKKKVTIPRGARTGTKIRIAGEGGPGPAPGDLYLVVNIQPHPTFEREGDDLRVDVPVDLYTALLGGEARVQTLNGDVVLTIPPETQSGRVFRLSGRGMPKLREPNMHGDLYARVVVKIPTHLTEQERTLFAQLAELRKKSS